VDPDCSRRRGSRVAVPLGPNNVSSLIDQREHGVLGAPTEDPNQGYPRSLLCYLTMDPISSRRPEMKMSARTRRSNSF
jgi:hypothetical protein